MFIPITLDLTPEEYNLIEEAARLEGMTMADFCRQDAPAVAPICVAQPPIFIPR
jgi:uncharacterized protein (DUF1778 family)